MGSLREPDIARLLAAFELDKLDRVPHFDFIDPGNVAQILDRERDQCARNDALSGSDAARVARATCMDFVLAAIQYWPGADTESRRVDAWPDIAKIHPANADLARQKVQEFTQA